MLGQALAAEAGPQTRRHLAAALGELLFFIASQVWTMLPPLAAPLLACNCRTRLAGAVYVVCEPVDCV